MNTTPTLLLQLAHETTSGFDAMVMAFISIAILVIASMSGKVQLGFKVPGFSTPLPRNRKKILKKHSEYFNKLSPENQKKFEQRVQEFIMKKHFIPRNIESVTEEMKVLIASCAIQLAFGLPKIFMTHFKRIIVYPNDYYSTINQMYHKGEVNPRMQAIVLSWLHFVEGYSQKDGRNLGLHEMTHALHLENRIANEEFAFFDTNALRQWRIMAAQEIENINSGSAHFFRKYAGTNHEEFLSVAVENFFERSTEFKEQLPELYANLALLLNQDPLKN